MKTLYSKRNNTNAASHRTTTTFRIVVLLLFTLYCFFRCTNEEIRIDPPKVELILPSAGIKGTAVTIYGEGFSKRVEEIEVLFNGVRAEVMVADHHSIIVSVPGGASTGSVKISVGKRETTGPVFTYQESGTLLDYAGTGFEGLLNGDPESARFSFPWGADKDLHGNLYVADRGNHIIRKIATDGRVSTFAGTGVPGYANGPASDAQFYEPVDVAVDASGNVFVSDFINTCIRKITPAGEVSAYAGLAGGIGSTDGTLTNARFFGPAGLTFDSDGNLFVADYFNHRIRKITPAGTVSTLAGSTPGCSNGTGASAQFNAPVGLATDAANMIYVADGFNHSIRKITPAGVVTRIAGTCSAGFSDGPVLTATFDTPVGVAVDENGDIIVNDSNNNRIRKIYVDANTVVSMVGTGNAGSANGIGAEGSLNAPTDLVYLGAHEFLIIDLNNHKLRKVEID